MKITFLGGVEEVTGSRYLVEHEGTKILVDCGLFQGSKEAKNRNNDNFPIEPRDIDAVVLTHAHIDHSGYVPALVKKGFKGKVYCSKATLALCSILLVDSGMIQEEDAAYASKHGYPNQQPLYTEKEAKKALTFFKALDYDKVVSVGNSLKITLIRSGHILGSSFVVISDGKQTLTFSGDLGRPNLFILKPPPRLKEADFLVLESTYGDKLHEKGDPIEIIGEVAARTAARGGVLIIPAFAVGRTQTILYCLHQLKENKVIPGDIPIFLDSPMAINVSDLLCLFKEEHKLSESLCTDVCSIATYTAAVEESKKINDVKGPSIIIAGSGMATGGRVLHHLKHFISDPNNTVLFVGYQAEGTRGRALVNGANEVEIHGKTYPVRAEIRKMEIFSAHADYGEILEWLEAFESSPKKLFLTHGEAESALSLKKKIEERFGWHVVIPTYLDSFKLD